MNQDKPKTIHAIAHFDFDGSCEDCACVNLEELICQLSKTKFEISTIPEGNRHEHCPLCIEEEDGTANPWKELKKKIDDAAQRPCLACGSRDDIEASHNCHPLDGGDLAAEILIVPLCKDCRRRWVLEKEFRMALIRDHPKQLDVVSF